MNADGSGRRQLTSDGNSTNPLFTPDKSKILFNKNTKLYSINVDGTGTTELSSNAIEQSISPNGNNILYAYFSSDLQIWRMGIDGSSPSQVTSIGTDTWGAKYLPNGTQFLFASNAATGRSTLEDIYIGNVDGSGTPTRLTSAESSYNNYYPAISYDGTKFAYYSWGRTHSNVWVRNINGSSPVNISGNDYASDDSMPSISYDGTKVVFNSNRTGTQEVYSANIDGTNLTKLTSIGKNIKPQFLPNGQILFSSDRDGKVQLYVMDADGNNQTRISDNTNNDGDGQESNPDKPSF